MYIYIYIYIYIYTHKRNINSLRNIAPAVLGPARGCRAPPPNIYYYYYCYMIS